MKKDANQDRPKFKKYEKPILTEYGNVEKLTQSGGGTRADGIHTRRK